MTSHEQTDAIIEAFDKRLQKEYRKAVAEVQDKLNDYLRRFEIKDEKWQIKVANGKATAAEYAKWREQQMLVGKKWEDLKTSLAKELHDTNVIAREIVLDNIANVYTLNFNYAAWEVERAAGINAFTLYNEDAVRKIIKENPELLPAPGESMKKKLAANKDIAWQKGQIQSVALQAIVQGESIPNIAKRIAREMGDQDHAATIRYARTAMTAAENAGKQDAYHHAEELGVKMEREWLAVHDSRTRHEHRMLDGQRRSVDEPFEVEGLKIMYPGDPTADPSLIWNCRCTTRAIVNGLEPQARKYRDPDIAGMTYEEWQKAKPTSDRITKQEEIAETMRWRYIHELYEDKDAD